MIAIGKLTISYCKANFLGWQKYNFCDTLILITNSFLWKQHLINF